VARWRCSKQSKWHAAVLLGLLSAASILALSDPAQAGFFDFLFGGPEQRSAPPPVNSYAEPSAPVSPAPLGAESVRQGAGGGGRNVAYCVRLCDGQHFPMERMANATPVETCRAMCPASKTKVFSGSDIGGAVARDGAHYADLDTAFIYRKQLVANCTCNGKDAFGLAPFDLSNDPTLRPGDIVSTKDGFKAYAGDRNGKAFTPVDASSLTAELNGGATKGGSTKVQVSRLSRQSEPPADADDDPGTITPSVDPRRQADR
jgi:hypothetical protein